MMCIYEDEVDNADVVGDEGVEGAWRGVNFVRTFLYFDIYLIFLSSCTGNFQFLILFLIMLMCSISWFSLI